MTLNNDNIKTRKHQINQCADRLLAIYTGSILTRLIEIGYQTGLFETMRDKPGSSCQISERARLNERYVREWLGAMVTADIVFYDQLSKTYTLLPEYVALLTGQTADNLAPRSQLLNSLCQHTSGISDCFRHGGGIPYESFQPEFSCAVDLTHRYIYDEFLVSGYIGAVKGLRDRLQKGIRVLDVGCGTGHAINLLAKEFPQSTFYGYDFDGEAINSARSEAVAMQLSNVHFENCDVATLVEERPYDLILALDAIHDQQSPDVVLSWINRSLTSDGIFLMVEFNFSSYLEDNIGNPLAPMYYGISVLHCLTVSLAVDGAGLGTVWGKQAAVEMLTEVGFKGIELIDAPRPQDCIFMCRKS